ncbi:hypothetical protein [Desulfovibrio sp. TomC]|uniref:hypothetical protein n=1 Tax=Desulfovibrio sp. TomC TaxID=1562888 RepID=UPI0005735FB7|nr:hypothetical protein [Desulfovibrio sp. TomC]KHK02542.1 hypothetical protein NY78_1899 [Desulfovibrio sp. TomC]
MRFFAEQVKQIRRSLSFSGRSTGATMLWAIAALVVLGGLAATTASMNPSALQNKLAGERTSSAYYASLAGLNYAKSMVEMANANAFGSNWGLEKLNATYTVSSGKQFTLSTKAIDFTTYEIVSLGVVQSATGAEANYRSAATVTYIAPSNLGEYNFLNPSNRPDYAKYSDSQTRDIPESFDNADIKTKNLIVGKNYTFGFGNIWYTGTNAGLSSQGVSPFGDGFRLFFTFKFATNIGDGFVVSFLNAAGNNYLSSGGDSAEGGMLGYAGDSRVYDSTGGGFSSAIKEYVDQSGFSKGLNPPKFGIEIDTYNNTSSEWYPTATKASCDSDNGFMNDSYKDLGWGSTVSNHVGIDYWGTDDPYYRKTYYGPNANFAGNVKRYSDVRHGEGKNASNSSADSNTKLKYFSFNVGTTYFFRMDVVKSGTNVAIKSWVGTCSGSDLNSSCTNQVYGKASQSSSHTGTLSDTQRDFVPSAGYLDKLSYVSVSDTLALTSAENTKFANFMWGFTSGSGVATQQIDFRNISLSLRP